MADSIKSTMVRLIRDYRSLPTLGESGVQIGELVADDRLVTARGEYLYRNLWGAVGERGTFDFSLKKDNLEPLRVKILPTERPHS